MPAALERETIQRQRGRLPCRPARHGDGVPFSELVSAGILLSILLVLRLANIFGYRYDSDETLLTRPDEYVFDSKGETIFRRRSVYQVMEALTMERIDRGLMKDRVAERCVETKTDLVVLDGRVPPAATEFVARNYVRLPLGVRVAGFRLPPAKADGAVHFELTLPSRYLIISPAGPVAGTLDGQKLEGGQELAPGMHTFIPDGFTQGPLVLFWARAEEHGYSPFVARR